jgi:hypothetical protein
LLKTIRIDHFKSKNTYLFPKPTYKTLGKSLVNIETEDWRDRALPTIKSSRFNFENEIGLKRNEVIRKSNNESLKKTNREVDSYLKKIKTYVSQSKQ